MFNATRRHPKRRSRSSTVQKPMLADTTELVLRVSSIWWHRRTFDRLCLLSTRTAGSTAMTARRLATLILLGMPLGPLSCSDRSDGPLQQGGAGGDFGGAGSPARGGGGGRVSGGGRDVGGDGGDDGGVGAEGGTSGRGSSGSGADCGADCGVFGGADSGGTDAGNTFGGASVGGTSAAAMEEA